MPLFSNTIDYSWSLKFSCFSVVQSCKLWKHVFSQADSGGQNYLHLNSYPYDGSRSVGISRLLHPHHFGVNEVTILSGVTLTANQNIL